MNDTNLQSLTTKKAREIGKKGGQASVKKRREKKSLREALLLLLNETVKDSTGKTTDKSVKDGITVALIQQALRGNVKAYEVIRDTIGEKPVENVAVAAPDTGALDEAFALLKGDANDPPGTGAAADC